MARKRVRLDELKPGPLRRESLSETQLKRLRAISDALDGIDGSTFEERERDFLRDAHPDNELRIWEAIASAYASFVAARELSPPAKSEAFGLLLLRSMSASAEDTLTRSGLKLLSKDEAEELLRGYR